MSDINEARARLQDALERQWYVPGKMHKIVIEGDDLATVLAQPAGVAAGWSTVHPEASKIRDALTALVSPESDDEWMAIANAEDAIHAALRDMSAAALAQYRQQQPGTSHLNDEGKA